MFKMPLRIVKSYVYCKNHRKKLIHLKKIMNNGVFIEVGWCSKCRIEYCEYSDVSSVYISNYEWLVKEGGG